MTDDQANVIGCRAGGLTVVNLALPVRGID